MSETIVTCKNCGAGFSGKYCNRCGEKVYKEHDKSMLHFFEDAVHFFTHFEGTFFNTLKTIFSKPGKLSLDYCNGIRKKYFKPLPFFMFLVLLYLIFPFFSGLNMPFKYYLKTGSYANDLIAKKTSIDMDSLTRAASAAVVAQNFSTQTKASAFAAKYLDSAIKKIPSLYKTESAFTKKSEKTSKVLLLILLPLTAIVIAFLSIRKRRYFFDHLVLATEINSFFLLFSFFIIPLVTTILFKLLPAMAAKTVNEFSIGILSYTMLCFFSAISFRRLFNDKWWYSLIKAILVVVAHFYIVQVIYKFILFALTFYMA